MHGFMNIKCNGILFATGITEEYGMINRNEVDGGQNVIYKLVITGLKTGLKYNCFQNN
jgi:hypothetical protein